MMFDQRRFDDNHLQTLAWDIMARHAKGQWPPMLPTPDDDVFTRYQCAVLSPADRPILEAFCTAIHDAESCKWCEAMRVWELVEQRHAEQDRMKPFISFLETIDF